MGGEDTDKIIRIPGESLLVSLSQEETNYRKKYLPDPAKLTDEKLVCTVCSASLAQNIHKGKDIFVHRALHVLLCEACYNFYGDGCFSVDEDGDDKYCRWCGQGGTLYLCSTCTCAFCQKCVKQNLKPNVLADLENDDWKCYICNPRPLYGCRTICWGAEELNKIGKEKEKEKLKRQKERLEKIEEEKKKKEEARKSSKSVSEEAVLTKKRTRNKDSDSSSPEVLPTKRTKRESKSGAGDKQNGSVSKSRRYKDDSSSDDMSEEDKRSSRTSRRKVSRSKKSADSSSDEYEVKRKSRSKQKKQSDDSSEEDKKRSRRRSVKKKADSSEDDTDDEKPVKRKRLRAKKKPSSDSSSDEKEKSKTKKKKKHSTDEDSDDDKKRKKASKKKDSDEESDNSTKKSKKNLKNKNTKNKSEAQDSDNEPKKVKKTTDTDDELKPKLNPKDLAENAMIKKRIKLAILWLNNTVKDIAELGGLISLRATKFCKKKINLESLKSYEDVINTVGKLKQLINGIHSNYDHIEKTLDGHLKPWKILTGIEDQENEKHPDADISNVVEEGSSKPNLVSQSEHEGVDKSENDNLDTKISNGKVENKVQQEDNVNLHWSGMSADESDTEENNATRALISKAGETLNRDEEDNNKNTKGNGGKDQSDEISHTDKEVPDEQISKNLVENEATEEKSKKKNSDESQDDEEMKVSKDNEDSNNESDEELPTKKKTSLLNSSPYKKGKEKSQEENVLSEKNNSTLSSSNSPKKKGQ